MPPANATSSRLFNADILSKFCNSPHGAPYDDGICAGYITAIADVLLQDQALAERLCVPRNLSTSDFSKLVTRHIARNPDDKRLPAAQVVRAALLKAFSC
ncbi:Rap1a/Tai family immunity protein [Anderseniella sp. Alg231-50]|uniref:Rap1a/Tai family immunity protein n=1 Tax=Anderseniella sp. Alg231-50 TaxID=1922226 RepID=UPI00307C282C